MTTPQIKTLQAGDKAPDITITDVCGKKVSLKDMNNEHILVAFFRYSGCPWCNLAIHRLSLEYKRLAEHDCEVIAFIQSDKTEIVDNIYNRHDVRPPFPIVADYEQKFYKKYGVRSSVIAATKSIDKIPAWVHSVKKHGFKQSEVKGDLFLVPAMFIIDGRTKKIVKATYGTSFFDHDTFVKIYESIIFNEL